MKLDVKFILMISTLVLTIVSPMFYPFTSVEDFIEMSKCTVGIVSSIKLKFQYLHRAWSYIKPEEMFYHNQVAGKKENQILC